MKITKSDLENYRFDRQQAEIYNDTNELKRLENIVACVKETTCGTTTKVIMARYINGSGLNNNGKRETWKELAQQLHYNIRYVKRLNSKYLAQIQKSH